MQTENEKKEIFESMPVGRALRIMAVPMVISQLIILIYNMADTFFVGRANNAYMVAGISMILPVFNICLSIAGLSGVGGGTLISRLMGRGNNDEARRVSVFSIYMSVIVAVFFSIVMFFFMDPILTLIGASENTISYARQYAFWVVVLGSVPTVLSNVFSNLIRSVGFSSQASFGIAMGGVLNIILDPLFMFVLLPAGSEALGAGMATFTSNCVACIYFLITLYRTRSKQLITLNPKWGMPSGRSIRSVFWVGIPSSLSTLLFDLDYTVLDRLMVAYGDEALAAIGIVVKAERFPLNVGIGICQGMVPLLAYNFSSHDYKRMDDILHCARTVGILIGIGSVIVYEIGAPLLMHIFIDDAVTVSLGTDFLRVRILATPFMFMCFSYVNTFNAFGEGNMSLLLGVLRWAVVNIPMLFILSMTFGMYGLVWSQFICDTFVALISWFIYRHYRTTKLPAAS